MEHMLYAINGRMQKDGAACRNTSQAVKVKMHLLQYLNVLQL